MARYNSIFVDFWGHLCGLLWLTCQNSQDNKRYMDLFNLRFFNWSTSFGSLGQLSNLGQERIYHRTG